jgi:hypothetical protein
VRILVTGSRDWTDGDLIRQEMRRAVADFGPADQVVIVHGGARGADAIAESIARGVGLDVECHPAAWDTRGRAAGIIRNSEMVNAGADVCLAFIRNQSRGATHCADAAEKAGIPTRRYTTAADPAEAAGGERG